MTPENLVDSVKLADYYVNGFNDSIKSSHTARVHVKEVKESANGLPSATVLSAPSLMDLVHAENIEPKDIALQEQAWFEHSDPYDLEETARIDPELQQRTIRQSDRFDIAEYVKLDDPRLVELITNVDTQGPGSSTSHVTSQPARKEPCGKPGEWSVDDFLK